ncbi:hypothetical protein TOTORO_01530 [Serratia phage vB_SmaS-Totoro]|nr:hypothetical protein TOTORO_01530 [Serratia phage vB_SmaS-Totoro]
MKRWNANSLYRAAGISSLRAEKITDYGTESDLLADITKTTGVIFDRYWRISINKYTDYLYVTIDYSTSYNPAMYGTAYFVVIQKDDVRDSLPFVYDDKNVNGETGFNEAVVLNAARSGKSPEQILESMGIPKG